MFEKFVNGVNKIMKETYEYKKWVAEKVMSIYKNMNGSVKIVFGVGLAITIGGTIIADGVVSLKEEK